MNILIIILYDGSALSFREPFFNLVLRHLKSIKKEFLGYPFSSIIPMLNCVAALFDVHLLIQWDCYWSSVNSLSQTSFGISFWWKFVCVGQDLSMHLHGLPMELSSLFYSQRNFHKLFRNLRENFPELRATSNLWRVFVKVLRWWNQHKTFTEIRHSFDVFLSSGLFFFWDSKVIFKIIETWIYTKEDWFKPKKNSISNVMFFSSTIKMYFIQKYIQF